MSLASTIAARTPPANLEAEQALLGALLANNKAYEHVGEFLRPEHFADPAHALIFTAIGRRIEAGQLADAVTLRAVFEHNGLLDEIGGVSYLAKLLRAMVGIINAGEYGRVIEDLWLRRRIIESGESMVNLAYGHDPELSARQVLAVGDEALLGLADEPTDGGLRTGQQVAEVIVQNVVAAMQRNGGLSGITWGLRGLDRMTGGLRPGQFVLVAGRPSMGKTSMGLRIAIGAAETGVPVLFISAEMAAEEVLARAAVAEAGLPLTAYTRGGIASPDGGYRKLNQAEFDRLFAASRRLGELPIAFDDTSTTVTQIRARARKMKRAKNGGLGLIVVDYLGRLRASERVQRFGLNSIVTELSQGLKDLAKQLEVPAVVLSQLSRQVEQREDKTPQLSDLRDSGSLEQDADLVVFLYRAHYYLRHEPQRGAKEKPEAFGERLLAWGALEAREKGRALAIIGKQRQGPTGPVRLRWDDETAQFSDDSSPPDPPGGAD